MAPVSISQTRSACLQAAVRLGQDLRPPSPGQELEGLQLSTRPRVAPFALLLASDSEKHPRPWTQ